MTNTEWYSASEAKKLVEMGFVVSRDDRLQNEYRYRIISPPECLNVTTEESEILQEKFANRN